MKSFPVLAVLLFLTPALHAALRVAPVFSDHLVLQRELPVPVWGWTEKGKQVEVEFAGQKKSSKAAPNGRWEVVLDPLKANASPAQLHIRAKGEKAIVIKDVLVGEVWLASGQSNMQWSVQQSREEDKRLAASESLPKVRLLNVPLKLAHNRLTDLESRWTAATPETTRNFSAVAFFFARDLHKQLNVPVGIINSSWGGSRIEPWIPREGFAQVKELAALHAQRLPRIPGTAPYNKATRRHLSAVEGWLRESRRNINRGQPAPPLPLAPPTLNLGHNQEIGLYQAMIHPLVPYGMRGFLWYQGESNNGEGLQYHYKMRALIAGWRKQWRRRDAPFLFVQLAPYNYGGNRPLRLAELWGAQLQTLTVPHTGMAVTTDIGNVNDIHPRNKSEVGRRLALWAMAKTYGKGDLAFSGPLFKSAETKGTELHVTFDHLAGGLASRDGKPLTHFELAGADGAFAPAVATISADAQSLVVTSVKVAAPKQVRFGWHQAAEPNLMNKAGLPASPFHSHWPHDPDLGRNEALGKPYVTTDENPWGWNGGLTDGSWDSDRDHCFATRNSAIYPKHVTIDLQQPAAIHAVRLGVPPFGSTKSVALSLSTDGKTFDQVAKHQFVQRKAQRKALNFDPRATRYVRVSFLDSHPAQVEYDRHFGFLTEVEAYAK